MSAEDGPPGLPHGLKDLEDRVRQARGRTESSGWNKPLAQTADERQGRRMLAMAFRLGTEMLAALAIGVGGGLLIDDWLGSRPWGLLIMFILGVGAGATNVYRAVGGLGYAPGYRHGKRDAGDGQDE